MFDLGKQSVIVECPACHFTSRVTLKQVRMRDVVICRGCKRNIQLEDQMKTVKKAIRDLGRAMRDLQDQLAAIGKIEIRL
jgi:transposase-like protein